MKHEKGRRVKFACSGFWVLGIGPKVKYIRLTNCGCYVKVQGMARSECRVYRMRDEGAYSESVVSVWDSAVSSSVVPSEKNISDSLDSRVVEEEEVSSSVGGGSGRWCGG